VFSGCKQPAKSEKPKGKRGMNVPMKKMMFIGNCISNVSLLSICDALYDIANAIQIL
jgi:hypothetical protein